MFCCKLNFILCMIYEDIMYPAWCPFHAADCILQISGTNAIDVPFCDKVEAQPIGESLEDECSISCARGITENAKPTLTLRIRHTQNISPMLGPPPTKVVFHVRIQASVDIMQQKVWHIAIGSGNGQVMIETSSFLVNARRGRLNWKARFTETLLYYWAELVDKFIYCPNSQGGRSWPIPSTGVQENFEIRNSISQVLVKLDYRPCRQYNQYEYRGGNSPRLRIAEYCPLA